MESIIAMMEKRIKQNVAGIEFSRGEIGRLEKEIAELNEHISKDEEFISEWTTALEILRSHGELKS